ncbi:MAG: 5'-methylthioadenosine/S-adenosylhomocysteine nucleosidase [Spirochaetia bacterium]
MIAVLGALQAEVYQMKRRITGVESCWWAGREMSQGDLGPRRVLCTWTGAGIAQAAITAQHICSRYKPEIILFGGIGGALNPIYELGDIVIAEDVIQWDIDTAAIGGGIGVFPGRQNDSRWVRELPADPALRKRLEQHCAGHAGKVYKGRFLSGDRFIPIKNGAEERGALNKALGGDIADMESSSIALAGKLNNTPVVLLRIVSDTVRAERPANFRKFIDRASETIADIFESFIKASIRQDPR